MTENEPWITVMCDICEEDSDPLRLTALAGDCWDARNIGRQLIRNGWQVNGDRHVCDACVADGGTA